MKFLTQFGNSIPGFDYSGDFNIYQVDPELEALFESSFESVIGALLGFLLGFVLVVTLLGVLMYVFQGLATYTVAKRRGIRNPWLAWVPVGNVWILGSLSDQYRYVTAGKVSYNRFVLLGLDLAAVLVSIVFSVSSIGSTAEAFAVMGMLFLPSLAISVAALVFYYIALYDFYCSTNPDNSVTALVVSILVSPSIPFFQFAYRKLDGGMPPRRETPVYESREPVQEVYAEPVILPEESAPVEEANAQEPENQL